MDIEDLHLYLEHNMLFYIPKAARLGWNVECCMCSTFQGTRY